MRKAPLLLLFLPTLLFADEIHLKGGGSFAGRIEERTDSMVKIDIGDGVIGVPTSRIERIVEGRSALDEYEDRAARLKPSDVNGWRSLGRWAEDQGLSTQARQAYEKVVALASNDAEAREALGFVRLNGQWMTEEESYRARGYVKYEGEWMTPAEAQTAQASASAEQARRDAERRAIDAEIAKAEAESRAAEAEERAQEAEEEARRSSYNYPTYWGGWGYGTYYWPSTGRSGQRPARPAARGGR